MSENVAAYSQVKVKRRRSIHEFELSAKIPTLADDAYRSILLAKALVRSDKVVWRLRARWKLLDVMQSISHTKSGCFSTCFIDSVIFYLSPILSHVFRNFLSSPPPSWNGQFFLK